MMSGGMIIGLVFNLLILVGIVLLIVWAVKRFTGNNSSPAGQSPKETLQARYARGELTREQYQQMLSDLG